jgi:YebC/PmpR family DNA-binding regulatory protein
VRDLSGHSKWANIKHRKAAQDAKKGNLFQKLVRAIIVAAKEGGGDPESNFKLKTAIDKAKASSVPQDNITRAIKRGTGEIEGASYEEIQYEGYGNGGVAIMMEALTDNRNRTASELRSLLGKNGGSLGESGCVAWMFERKGVVQVKGRDLDEDELMLVAIDAGAEELEKEQDGFSVYCDPSQLTTLKDALESEGYDIEKAELDMIPQSTIQIDSKDKAEKILKLMEQLEDHDDIQNVYSNFDIPDEIMNELE